MTWQEVEPEKLSDATVVVIDVLLATTTLLTTLENGARSVLPVASLEEAEEVGGTLDRSRTLRGGEQDGTRAISSATPAKKLLLGCLRNAPAAARYLEESGTESVYVVCAGSAGRFTTEDFLGASAILSRLNGDGYLDDWRLNDAAWLALDFAECYKGKEKEALKRGRAGRWFLENDMAEEFEFVGDVGASELVPEVAEGQLKPVSPASHQQDADSKS